MKLIHFWHILIGVVVAVTGISTAIAQSDKETEKDKNVIYRKKSKVDFSDAVIEGKGKNPEGIYVVTPPKKKFKGLIRLRPNFHKELIRDTLLLK